MGTVQLYMCLSVACFIPVLNIFISRLLPLIPPQMIAKGKDCSDLFPAVVKNVVSKNSEIKKLVYVYLVRYAEEQQDLALLSISTFQKGLKDPNQLIRASALRVLSSIRVPIIAPIMMLAIKEVRSKVKVHKSIAGFHTGFFS